MKQFLSLFFMSIFIITYGYAQTGNMTYQGRLLESGSSVTGTRNIAVTIYDNVTAGNVLVPTQTFLNTNISNGLYSVTLTGVPASAFANGTAYIEITVNSTNLSPRLPLNSVPFAFVSDGVKGVTASPTELNVLDGITASTTELNKLDGLTASTSELNLLTGVTSTTTELNYTDGVTSAIQTQLDNKANKNFDNVNGTLAIANGGTGQTTANAALNALLPTQTGNSGKFLTTNASSTSWISNLEKTDEFTATDNQVSFNLSQTPKVNSVIKMYINGVRISNNACSILGTVITYTPSSNGNYSLISGDRIQFDYIY